MPSIRALVRGESAYRKCLAHVGPDEVLLNISPSNNHKVLEKALPPGVEAVHTYELSSPFDADFPGSRALYEEFLAVFGELGIPPRLLDRDVVVFSADEDLATAAALFLAGTGRWAHDAARDLGDRGVRPLHEGESPSIDPGHSSSRVVSTIGYKGQTAEGFLAALRAARLDAVLDARWLPHSYPETWAARAAVARELPGIAWHSRRLAGNPWLGRPEQGPEGWIALYTRYLDRFGRVILPWIAGLTPGHLAVLCREARDPPNTTSQEACHRILLAQALVRSGLARPGKHIFPASNAA